MLHCREIVCCPPAFSGQFCSQFPFVGQSPPRLELLAKQSASMSTWATKQLPTHYASIVLAFHQTEGAGFFSFRPGRWFMDVPPYHKPSAEVFFQRIDKSLFHQPEGAGFFSSGQAVGFWMQRRVLRVRKQIHNPTTPPEGKRTSPPYHQQHSDR